MTATTVSNIYDQLITRLSTDLTSYVRLPNAYNIEDNSALFLKAGYAVAFGSGENTNKCLGGKVTIRRQFIITLTKQYIAKENAASDRATIEKQLLEDQLTVIKNIENDPSLLNYVASIKYVSDNGVNYLAQSNDQFLTLETTFSAEYFENLS